VSDYIQLRTVGVPVRYVLSIRKSGHRVADADKIVEMWTVGVQPGDLNIVIPTPPPPPRAPKVSPKSWKPPPTPGPDSHSGDG
jgi:hypothetical protein